jgi:beta-glucanase (GH16 family)
MTLYSNRHKARFSLLLIALLLSNTLAASAAMKSDPIDANSNSNTASQLCTNTQTNSKTFFCAINVGGSTYTALDGTRYEADRLAINSPAQSIESIKGSQDPELFKTYREGQIDFSLPVPNGEYQVIFKFAEPLDMPVGSRIFEVYAEDNRVVERLDIRLARDNKPYSALVRTATEIVVHDQQLDLKFNSIIGQPLLSAIIIQQKRPKNNQWQLIWSDEFNYNGAPDPKKWNIDVWPAKKVNGEDQAYTDRNKNLTVKDGNLIITAYKEAYDNAQYTSGRVHSKGKGDFLYGRADVRAKLPAGQGTWSAIWMLPSDPYRYATQCREGQEWQGSNTCDAWPNSGEIDIMEHVGYDMQTVHGTVHTKAYYWMNWEQRKASIEGIDIEKEFHVYSVEWSPTTITVLFDNTAYFSYSNENKGWREWPFDHPYHLILNLAIGGDWGRAGGPIDDSLFPAQMTIDYVRVFQKKDR